NISEAMRYGDYHTPEQTIPAEPCTDEHGKPLLWESCMTLNDHWGYARDDHDYKSPAQVVRMLVDCVSKNGNLLLNVGPTAKGEIPPESVRVLEAVGDWMSANADGIYGCGATDLPKPDWGRFTKKPGTLYAHVFDKPMGPIALAGLAGKVKRARLVADGSEVSIQTPWMVRHNTADAFLNLPGVKLPDAIDTVIRLELA
ncbi:MAG TPA: alpha-L-fucosidase, partial [Planctomycetota bacterium]|nr:alpha-L-fucosidase [Planctomycetota bacterium]